ncbi:MAG: BrnA antitoxin family protein [Proteobacteria bacterium]|nr:BrnA antitoxin family protein [Pseudomonadota bacterium]
MSTLDSALFKPLPRLSAPLQGELRGRPRTAVATEHITIRLSPDVMRTVCASGDGWQTRVETPFRESR